MDEVDELEAKKTLEVFTELYSDGELKGDAVLGIAAQLEAQGEESLSERQREVIESIVHDFCSNNTCELCGSPLELDDVAAFVGTRMCSYHADVTSKDRSTDLEPD
jgi:hypothetical protein